MSCSTRPDVAGAATHCPGCGRPGRLVTRITVKAMVRPEALEHLKAAEHRFCASASCSVVYFGVDETLDVTAIVVPVFQKEPAGDRRVCYCLEIGEADLRQEILKAATPTAADRITTLVQAGRCACEVKNPQGSCCLGNVVEAAKDAKAALDLAPRRSAAASTRG